MRVQTENFGNLRAVRYEMLNRKYNYPVHIHQYAELAIPISGDLIITVNGREEELSVGKAAFVSPFLPHSYHSSQVNKLALFLFSASMLPDFFKTFDGKMGDRAVFRPTSEVLELFELKLFEKDDIDLYDVKGCIYLILGDYLRQVRVLPGLEGNTIAGKVVEYINEHIVEPLNLSSIASALGYNPNYLSSCLQKLFGMNLRSLIASIRSDKAKYLLWETDKTGLEICFECGFGSERSFHRQFKEITGKTPKEYRSGYVVGNMERAQIKYF